MAVLHEVWVPTVVVAHILGVILLLYSLEKVNGIVTKAWKRLFSSEVAPAAEDGLAKAVSIGRTLSLTASATSGVHHNAAFGVETPKASLKQDKTWIRGCDCQVCPSTYVMVRRPARGVVPSEKDRSNCLWYPTFIKIFISVSKQI